MMRYLLYNPKKEKDIQKQIIFKTRCIVSHLFIHKGFSENIVFQIMVEKITTSNLVVFITIPCLMDQRYWLDKCARWLPFLHWPSTRMKHCAKLLI